MPATTEMIDLFEALKEYFGDTLRHVKGNLFEIKEDLIELPQPFDPTATELKAGNPRWITTSDGKQIAKGLQGSKKDTEKAESLMAAIRDHGMDHPIKVRVIREGDEIRLVCINGERRMRARQKLRKNKAKCYNQETGKKEPAEQVLEFIECRLGEWDEETTIEQSVVGNDTSEDIGHAATANVVRCLKAYYEVQAEENSKLKTDKDKSEWVGKQIRLRMGNKSETWLRDEYELLKLDEKTFEALQNEVIDRKVAIALASIADVEDRLERLGYVCEALDQYISEKKDKIKKDLERLQVKQEAAEEKIDDAKLDGEDPSEAEEELEAAEEKIEDKKTDLEDLEENPPSATTRQLDEANRRASRSGNSDGITITPLSYAKVNRSWKKRCDEIIKADGQDEDGNDLEIDLEDARLVSLIIDTMGKGKKAKDGKAPIEIEKVLKQHARSKARREK